MLDMADEVYARRGRTALTVQQLLRGAPVAPHPYPGRFILSASGPEHAGAPAVRKSLKERSCEPINPQRKTTDRRKNAFLGLCAFVVVVFGIVAKYGIESLYMCTLLAGIILVMLGITRLGTAVKFIPRPVVVGFTNGIAVIIASTKIKDFFGLKIDKVPGDFLARIEILCKNVHTLQASGTALGCPALAIIIACNRPPLWPPVISRWRWFQ